MRVFVPAVVVLAVAGCSGSGATPTGMKAPPPAASTIDTLLVNGSIPASGGTLTVNKSGDPLNGLTLSVSPGAFSSALSVTIGSSTNKNVPTADGIVPISPVVHIATSAGGYAKGAISLKVPVTVAANTYPVAVLYDSATKAMQPMTTITYDGSSVTAVTGHLNNANLSAAAEGAARSHAVAAASGSEAASATVVVYAIPTAVLNQDWDTGFKPGTNDWDLLPVPTEAAPSGPILGAAATELWYYNTKASPAPLNGRFPAIHNSYVSDRTGYRWTSVIDGQVGNLFNSYASAAYQQFTANAAANADTLQFDQIRASFALPVLNGGTALPVFVDLQSAAVNGFYYLIAYKAIGNKIYVADPLLPGDATRFLQLPAGGAITPYTNPGYKAGVSFTTPLATALGVAVPLATVSSSYQQVSDGTIGNGLFPAAAFYSWNGALNDTMYVVDSLRFWAQCAQCQNGFATTLSPSPSEKVESSYSMYFVSGAQATDSAGFLGANGFLVTASVPVGTQRTIGIPLASADSPNENRTSSALVRWLDWHQFIVTNLQATIAPAAPETQSNTPLALQVTVAPSLLPANVAYQWSFGDTSHAVTVQNNANVSHTYTDSGTYTATVRIIDNRNAQVIAKGTTTVTIDGGVEVWQIQSLHYAYVIINGVTRRDTTPNDSLVFDITPGSTAFMIAVHATQPPNYPIVGLYYADTDSVNDWPKFLGFPLGLVSADGPFNIVSYTETGTPAQGTITGTFVESAGSGGTTNVGRSASLTKNGTTLSGYVRLQGTAPPAYGSYQENIVDSLVAVRVQ